MPRKIKEKIKKIGFGDKSNKPYVNILEMLPKYKIAFCPKRSTNRPIGKSNNNFDNALTDSKRAIKVKELPVSTKYITRNAPSKTILLKTLYNR